MGEHSPTPWTIDLPQLGFSAIHDAEGKLVFGLSCPVGDERIPDEVIDANARLLKYAPDLLEACKAALVVLEQSPPSGTREKYQVRADTIRQLRSAISRAEGG